MERIDRAGRGAREPDSGSPEEVSRGPFDTSDLVTAWSCRRFLQALTFPASPSSLDFRVPSGFDLVVGDRAGRVFLCKLDSAEEATKVEEISRERKGAIGAAFAISRDTLVVRSVVGEMQIFRRVESNDWLQVFQNSTDSRVASCYALDHGLLATVMGDGKIGAVKLTDENSSDLRTTSISGHMIRDMAFLTGRRAIALTSTGVLLAIDDVFHPRVVDVLPSAHNHHFSTLHRLSDSSLAVCRIPGIIEHWRYCEQTGWVSSALEFGGSATQVLAVAGECIVVRAEKALQIAEIDGDGWQRTILDSNSDATASKRISTGEIVVGGFRGSVTVWHHEKVGCWRKQELTPHTEMVAFVNESESVGLVTAAYDHSVRWWGKTDTVKS